MITNYVGKGTTKITKEEFEKVPSMIGYELENSKDQKPIFQFKFMDMYGNWNLVDIVYVENEGVNFLCSRIELKDK